MSAELSRCPGVAEAPQIYLRYHDTEWGKPEYGEQKLYEMFLMEFFQAGLSWLLLLNKRENFRRAFDGFDVEKIARYDSAKIASLLQDPGIVRSRGKIEAAVLNARIILEIKKEFGSFSDYLWHFTDGKTLVEDISVVRNGRVTPRTVSAGKEMARIRLDAIEEALQLFLHTRPA